MPRRIRRPQPGTPARDIDAELAVMYELRLMAWDARATELHGTGRALPPRPHYPRVDELPPPSRQSVADELQRLFTESHPRRKRGKK